MMKNFDHYGAAVPYLGQLKAEAVKRWASRQGLEATSYKAVSDVWQFTDGEVYTTRAIILDQAAYDLRGRSGEDDRNDGNDEQHSARPGNGPVLRDV